MSPAAALAERSPQARVWTAGEQTQVIRDSDQFRGRDCAARRKRHSWRDWIALHNASRPPFQRAATNLAQELYNELLILRMRIDSGSTAELPARLAEHVGPASHHPATLHRRGVGREFLPSRNWHRIHHVGAAGL